MKNEELQGWEVCFEAKAKELIHAQGMLDASHDLAHLKRVVRMAKKLALEEGARLEVVVPAAWLHDWVNLPKDHPERTSASKYSAMEALNYLRTEGYPEQYLEAIGHAIEAHSFSAEVKALSLEAKVVQDADRLDAIGAIGIARCFFVAGRMGKAQGLYHDADPYAAGGRDLNDQAWVLDHFYRKLFPLCEKLNTASARNEAKSRAAFMEEFIRNLLCEGEATPGQNLP